MMTIALEIKDKGGERLPTPLGYAIATATKGARINSHVHSLSCCQQIAEGQPQDDQKGLSRTFAHRIEPKVRKKSLHECVIIKFSVVILE